VALEETALDAAKSSIVYGVTKNVATAGRAVRCVHSSYPDFKYRHYMLLSGQNELKLNISYVIYNV
jgi:hypothetical protein